MPTQFISIRKSEYRERKEEASSDPIKNFPVYTEGMQVICFCINSQYWSEIICFGPSIFVLNTSKAQNLYVHTL